MVHIKKIFANKKRKKNLVYGFSLKEIHCLLIMSQNHQRLESFFKTDSISEELSTYSYYILPCYLEGIP